MINGLRNRTVAGSVLMGIALLSSTALADTTGSVTLGGSVASTLDLEVNATGGATTLDLDGDGSSSQHIVNVAGLVMSTNNETGFLLTSSSGSLTKAGGTSIPYQVTSVIGGGTAPVAGAFLIASGSDYTMQTSAAGGRAEDLYIMYTPATLQDSGNYAGSISLTVSDR